MKGGGEGMDRELPSVLLTARPAGGESRVEHMDLGYRLEGFSYGAGDELFRVNLMTVTIPFCPMEALRAWDDLGELPLSDAEEEAYPVRARAWRAGRAPAGTIGISYRITPRELPEGYRSSPYFDFRNEEGGANGAGITFLATVASCGPCRLRFEWELSRMPEGCAGVSSHGEGAFELSGKPALLVNAFYAVGRVRAQEDGRFGFYWFSEPGFDLGAVASWTRRMFVKMAAFFRDGGKPYRIFVRRDPFEKSGGGTALHRSYMFGYSDAMRPSLDGLKNLLCHEMAHNWTRMKDEPYGECTWYLEGGAEYYSVMLPLRLREITRAQALHEIQRRTDQYYLSPFRQLPNREAAARSWTERRAQRVPYGRGFFYLAGLDARIRRATGGRSGIDEVVLELIGLGGEEGNCGNADFIRLVEGLSGLDIAEEFSRMAAGEAFTPDPESFDGLFGLEEIMGREEDSGEPARTFVWSIRGKGGNAYGA